MLWRGKIFGAAQRMHSTGSTPAVEPKPHGPVLAFFRDLGPGLITGAADDDPSGISTYSVAGARMAIQVCGPRFAT
jgi:hypothetical protein